MSKKISLILAITLLFSNLEAKNFNSSGLSKVEVKPELNKNELSQTGKQKPAARKFKADSAEGLDLQKIGEQINALNLITKTETNREKKIDLYLRKSQLLIGEAKLLSLARDAKSDFSEKEKSNYKEAQRILSGLQAASKSNSKRLAMIYYLQGQINYEYNQIQEFKTNFKNSIALDSKSTYAPTISLILAEQEYDEEKYQDAIKTYQQLYAQMSDYQKAVADYKTAWSYLALENKTDAKRYFLRIVKAKKEPAFVEDSLKDLAFVSAQSLDENQFMTYGIETFPDPKERAKFYYLGLLVYYQIDKKKNRKFLFDELLSIQKDPYERAKIFALNISYQRKEYPSLEAYKAINEFESHFSKMDPKASEQFLFKDASILEEDSESIIRFFTDGYAGRINAPQQLKKEFLGQALKRLIFIHLKIFQKSTKKIILYSLWIDTCADSKDQTCLFSLTRSLRELKNKEPDFLALYSQSYLELINLIDEKYEKEPQTFEVTLVSLLENFLKEFPKNDQNKKLGLKLSSIYLKKEKFKEALPILQGLYATEANVENFYKLSFAKFKLEQYQQILADEDFAKFQDARLTDLKREISLKLAQKGIEKGNFTEYENNLKIFFASNPEKDKAILAYKDYFLRLLKDEKLDEFIHEWSRLSEADQARKEFNEVKSQALNMQITKGDFKAEKSLFIIKDEETIIYQSLLVQRALRYPMSLQEMQQVRGWPKEKRNYILNILSINQPKMVIDLLSAQSKLDEDEKKILFSSILILRGNSDFKFTTNEIKLIQNMAPEKMWPLQPSKLEKEIDILQFPNSKMNLTRYSKVIENLVAEIKKIRKKAIVEIPQLKMDDKVNLLKTV
ncbi:MAG: tetratricopeptide repeat protein [Pseudobdellovibrionaceae bacterium]